MQSPSELIRATLLDLRANPFREPNALRVQTDGGLLVQDGRIRAIGTFASLQAASPDAVVLDRRDGFVLPGFVDTHVHFPQVRIIGRLGRPLLEWLQKDALPEEARMADRTYSRCVAHEFLHGLLRHGTTTASVFGSHYAPSMQDFFEAAAASGLRIASGLVLGDQHLLPELHTTPERAFAESSRLITRFHGTGRLLYSVTPRFALSASEGLLDVCQALLRSAPDLRFQTHLNENHAEIKSVKELFPWAEDYLAVYERFALVGPHSIFAHNLHASDSELSRLGRAGAAVSHCPTSNCALGSGLFPLRRHLAAGVRVALGSDVGAGTGFGIPKEALQAFFLQQIQPDGVALSPAHLLYLSTLAGAEALQLDQETGNFAPGKSADWIHLVPPQGSELAHVMARAESAEEQLAALFALAGPESIVEVRVGHQLLSQ